jgi:Phage integrase family
MADFLDYRARLGSDFPRVRFHNLRCSHATQLVLAGVHPKVAQERFWHSTVTTTPDLYGHDAGGCASRLDAAFGGTIRAIGEQKRNRRTFRGISFGSNFGRSRRPEAGELSIFAGLAQWQCSGFVNRRSGVRIPHPAPDRPICLSIN